MLEHLESRQLLSATVTTPLSGTSGDPGTTSPAIDLSTHFDDPSVGSTVQFTTELGDIDLQLDDAQKPITTANFLNYVKSGRYNGTIVHRKTDLNTDGIGVIQGGGYTPPISSVNHITTDAPIQNEFTTNGINHNVAGTIAMAKTSDPNSATSEWFINTADNSSALDNPQNSGGFTVFGTVVNNTMPTVDAIAALPKFTFPKGANPNSTVFSALPLRNYTQTDYDANTAPGANNFVTINASVMPKLTFTATSSNPALVTPVISGNGMVLQYGQGTGTATITVTATGADNVPVTQKFTAGVGLLGVNLGGTTGARLVTFTDADGTNTSIALRGSKAAAATVSFSGTGLTMTSNKGVVAVSGTNVAAADISATGTDAKTTIAIAGNGGDNNVSLGGLSADGAVKSIVARNTILSGNLTTGGALGALILGAVDSGTVQIGGAATDRPAAIVIGSGMDANLTSAPAIKSLRTASFASTDMTLETITAPAVGSINTTSDLAENVTVAGPVKSIKVGGNLTGTVAAGSIGNLRVNGDVSNANIALNQAFSAKGRDLGVFNVGGTIANTVLRSTGNIGTVSADSLNASTLFAGVDPATTGLPLAASEFVNDAALQQLRLKTGYTASNVAAKNLGKLSIGTLQTSNAGQRFGFAADKIALLTGSTAPGVKFALKKLDTPQDLQTQGQGLDLGDAQVTLV